MKNKPAPEQMDPMTFAKLIADVVNEDAPPPEGWGHRRFMLTSVDDSGKQPDQTPSLKAGLGTE